MVPARRTERRQNQARRRFREPLKMRALNSGRQDARPPRQAGCLTLHALRTLAVSRIYLDNFDPITACWMGHGLKLAQGEVRWVIKVWPGAAFRLSPSCKRHDARECSQVCLWKLKLLRPERGNELGPPNPERKPPASVDSGNRDPALLWSWRRWTGDVEQATDFRPPRPRWNMCSNSTL